MNALPVGTRLGEFELTRTLGDGGFGIVYLAWDHSLERQVALKEYMPASIAARQGGTEIKPFSERHQDTFDTGMRSFINEAKLLARFDHPALVKVYRFWEANGTAYMVMPFYEGKTLRDTVRALGEAPDEDWLLALLAPLIDALAVLHANQCYHRDIAPDNIILLAESGRPLLLDFGAARRVIGETTQALTAILKPGYAPVEQYAEVPGLKQGGWTDVYALAAVVHWAITGKTPPNSVSRMFSDTYVPLAEAAAGRYSAGFLAAVDRALAVLPDDRTQSVGALRIELGLDDGERTIAAPPTAWADPDATVLHPSSRTSPAAPVPRSAAPASRVTGTGRTTGGRTAGPMSGATTPPRTGAGSGAGTAARPSAEPADAQSRPPPTTSTTGAVATTAATADPRHDDNATVITGPASAPAGRSTQTATGAVQPSAAGAPKRFPVGLAVGAAAVALAGGAALWWSLQKAPASAPSPAAQQAPQALPPPTATTRANTVAPSSSAAAAASAGGEAAAASAASAAAGLAERPSPTVVQVPPNTAPAASSPRVARPAPRADTPSADAARPAAVPSRTKPETTRVATPRTAPAPAEGRAEASGGNRAECARILQQMSLGDSSPELFARGKTLGCR